VDGNQVAAITQTVPQPYPGFNTFAIGGSRMLFLVGAIGGLAAVRMIAGLLLAVGPLFVAFLLFENTRSLFEGWIRVLAGAALAATQRREAGTPAAAAAYTPGRGDPAGAGGRPQAHSGRARDIAEPLGPVPLGQSFPRRTRGRVSASAGRRDRRT